MYFLIIIAILPEMFVIDIRAYDALRENHLMKLIPAVGILAFATWGLRPLLRLARATLFEVRCHSLLYIPSTSVPGLLAIVYFK